MTNRDIAAVFYEMANVLDIKGESGFRVNAYNRGAQVVESLSKELSDVVKKDPEGLKDISGIGDKLREKIVELVETGKCESHQNMLKGFPKGLLEMLKLRGVGPKKVKLFYNELNITTIKQLKKAARDKMLSTLPRMGEKSEFDILQSLKEQEAFSSDRFLIDLADREAKAIISYMEDCDAVKTIQFAGSLRRAQESIGDLDILVTNPKGDSSKIMEYFVNYRKVYNVIAKGDTKSSVILISGIQVDLRVVESKSFGAALHYFTGSKHHNIKLRDIAKRKGLKVNEYGVFKGDKLLGGKTEEEVFELVGLPFVPPEIRRNDGEFEYAEKHKKFPKFVELKDIKGDLHTHSSYSDGRSSILDMAETCVEKGYEYFAMSDHSPKLTKAGGMKEADIRRQWKEIDKVQKKLGNKIKIFKSSEVDINKDGSLDFPASILEELDFVIISAHFKCTDLDREAQTARLIRAIENPYAKIWAHPTNRKINKRAEMDFDMEKAIKACVDNGVALEINSQTERLDLFEKYIMMAREMGAMLAVNTDAHHVEQLSNMKYGVGMARRGWCEKKQLLNTMKLAEIDNFF